MFHEVNEGDRINMSQCAQYSALCVGAKKCAVSARCLSSTFHRLQRQKKEKGMVSVHHFVLDVGDFLKDKNVSTIHTGTTILLISLFQINQPLF